MVVHDAEEQQSLLSEPAAGSRCGCGRFCFTVLGVVALVASAALCWHWLHPTRALLVAQVAAVTSVQPVFPGRHGNVTSAVCISGGGPRAYSVALGAIRALEELQLMRQVDALSSNSGSSWFSAGYMFASGTTIDLLGGQAVPSNLSMQVLRQPPPPLGKGITRRMVSFFEQIIGLPADYWCRVVGKLFLEPFDLDADALLAGSLADVARIQAANPLLRHQAFLVPREDRPKVFVMAGTLVAPQGFLMNTSSASFQMSPDFSGSPFYPFNQEVWYEPAHPGIRPHSLNLIVGGGLLESFAFGGAAPDDQNSGQTVSVPIPQRHLYLRDMIGISSWAPGASALTHFVTGVLDPLFGYWPVISEPFSGSPGGKPYRFGDGGLLDNTAILQMLQRGATRILSLLVFTGTDVLTETVDICKVPPSYDFSSPQVAAYSFTGLFGYCVDLPNQACSTEQVFRREALQSILCEFQTQRRAGIPAVVKRKLLVLPNSKWGIRAGSVEVVFWYVLPVASFAAQLPADTQAELAKGTKGSFPEFPNMATMFVNPPDPIRYKSEQVNLLAALADYVIHNSKTTIETLFRTSTRGSV